MTVDEMIAVLQAYKAGKKIQSRVDGAQADLGVWSEDRHPAWNFGIRTFRVAPEPREFWCNEYENIDLSGAFFDTKEEAEEYAASNPQTRGLRRKQVKFVEVIED